MKTLKVPDLVGGKLLVVTMLDFLLVWPFFILKIVNSVTSVFLFPKQT